MGRKTIERDGKRHYRHSREGQEQHRDEERDRRTRRPGRRGRSRRMGVRVAGGTCAPQGRPKAWTALPMTTKAKTGIVGLTVGTVYCFRVQALTPKTGLEDWSQIVSLMVHWDRARARGVSLGVPSGARGEHCPSRGAGRRGQGVGRESLGMTSGPQEVTSGRRGVSRGLVGMRGGLQEVTSGRRGVSRRPVEVTTRRAGLPSGPQEVTCGRQGASRRPLEVTRRRVG